MKIDFTLAFLRLASDVDLDPFTVSYCCRRIKSEGFQFLSVTLPKLSKAVLSGLETGFLDRSSLTCFAWKRQSLRVFSKFLDQIFDPSTGLLYPNPDVFSIYCLRQICEYNYKLATAYSEKEVRTATEAFVALDSTVPTAGEYDDDFVDKLRADFETHYRTLSKSTVGEILEYSNPRPGPGTFSRKGAYTKTTGNPWYVRKHLDYSVPSYFKKYAYASRPLKKVYSYNPISESFDGPGKPLRNAPMPTIANDRLVSEVLFVPKDSRGPRTIVREPFPTLRYHMAYNKFLADNLEEKSFGRINFQDQSINRSMAQSASLDKKWATIDLSNASDSVSADIMAHVFRHSPGLRTFCQSRTTSCSLPDGREIKLKKLSGMGSGLTFPSMGLLIHLACTRAIVDYYHIPYKRARLLVYVYGDDIIVPTHMVSIVYKALERVSLRVNKDKSFWRGHFRESCGGDFFKGQDVAPVRLRMANAYPDVHNSKCTITISGSLAIVGLERHCRELYHAGLHSLMNYYYSILERAVGKLPTVSGDSPVIGRYSLTPMNYEQDGCGNYCTIRALMPSPLIEEHESDPYMYLRRKINRSISTFEDLLYPDTSGSSLGEVEVPRRIKLVRRRISAYRLMG
jgi:hypothetical protein